MNQRVFIIHGWDGHPDKGWFPWLKSELENRKFQVIVPKLPGNSEPRIQNWVPEISRAVGDVNDHTYFVGHSMGCQAIARYIENLPIGTMAGGAVFVAGFFTRLTNIENDDISRSVVAEWLDTPLDLQKVRAHLGKSIAIFSDNDPFVPLDNQEAFIKELGSEVVVARGQGHFSGSNGVTALPSALEAILKVTL